MKFNHIGIVVKDLNCGLNFFKSFLELKDVGEVIIDKVLGVKIQFLKDWENISYELISPLNKSSPVANSLNEKKNLINHIAYSSKYFEKDLNLLRTKNFIILGEPKKALAFNNARVAFFLSNICFIIELIEEF